LIIKKRVVSFHIRKLQALERRLALDHPKRKEVSDQLSRRLAGYRGEESLNYHLATFSEKDFYILHDLRLHFKDYHFQLDTLILSPCFFLILETKNYSGRLYFDPDFNQLVRTTDDGKQEIFPDPISQVERQYLHFSLWLQSHKFPQIPIIDLVLISNPYTYLETAPGNKKVLQKVLHSIKLPSKVSEIQMKYKEEKYLHKDLRKLSNLILKHDSPYNATILEQFAISAKDLVKGVQCPTCFFIPMKRKRGEWVCSHCGHHSNDAHLDSLRDYAILISNTITNKELRDFLQIDSASISAKLLAAANFPSSDTVNRTKYHIYWVD
jgi:ribosomal protein L37AE/L43A